MDGFGDLGFDMGSPIRHVIVCRGAEVLVGILHHDFLTKQGPRGFANIFPSFTINVEDHDCTFLTIVLKSIESGEVGGDFIH